MEILKQGVSKDGKPMHYSVGAIIRQDDRYLLIDRGTFPFGFAGVAGHIDGGEKPETAIVREVLEEVGLRVVSSKLLLEEEADGNLCNRGVGVHYWYVFECETTGEIKRNERETKMAGWYTAEEIKKLELEPGWRHRFEKMKVILR